MDRTYVKKYEAIGKPMNFSQALELIKKDKKVTCLRWNKLNTVVMQVYWNLTDSQVLILRDETRDATVLFTPSNENLFQDLWIEVEPERTL